MSQRSGWGWIQSWKEQIARSSNTKWRFTVHKKLFESSAFRPCLSVSPLCAKCRDFTSNVNGRLPLLRSPRCQNATHVCSQCEFLVICIRQWLLQFYGLGAISIILWSRLIGWFRHTVGWFVYPTLLDIGRSFWRHERVIFHLWPRLTGRCIITVDQPRRANFHTTFCLT